MEGTPDHVNVAVPLVAGIVGLVLAYLVVIAFVGGRIPGLGIEVSGGILLGLVALYLAPVVLFAVVWGTDRLVNLGRRRTTG